MRSIILTVGMGLSANCFAAATPVQTFSGSSVKNLVVENSAGNISVVSHQEKSISVATIKKDFDEKNCTLTVQQTGGELLVKVEQESDGRFADHCEVDMTIRIPHEKSLDYAIKLGAGNIELSDLTGDMEFQVGAGDVVATNMAMNQFEGKAGAGNVELKGHVNKGQIKVGVGNVDVTLTATADGHFDVKTGTGNATVNLPPEAKVAASASTGLGTVENKIKKHENPNYNVSIKTGIGNATIRSF